jgi:hypothetical protein
VRWTVQRAVFHLLEEPVPTLADPFPADELLPGAYELHLPSDGVTIWRIGHFGQVLGPINAHQGAWKATGVYGTDWFKEWA